MKINVIPIKNLYSNDVVIVDEEILLIRITYINDLWHHLYGSKIGERFSVDILTGGMIPCVHGELKLVIISAESRVFPHSLYFTARDMSYYNMVHLLHFAETQQ